ncbi:2-amino-4-hydroxy-6-hydroxymethyldihydropteridine diphosphokinase [Sorangium cellulosum]|uniref:2-amino-4-hydroxy-6-hydroxymethyldihydropteridine pyrophosphokinase n=1 Tax=Sorangium cellulosum TaxID=56 RepID=A0A150R049_SORCE|nr:2-amino-4-hydroxy-6-hydroxymethyldihydropteridine diphosphokinase [Sorangium cellulosum]KYF73629.1 folic acid synthesis protein [Sorangium cellulosum]
MRSHRRVVIGLGSSVGDRLATIRAAVTALDADPDIEVVSESPRYESPPAGGPPQGDYVNAAVLVATSLPAREILERTLAVERSLGRRRPDPVRWGPRTIDLDLLWIEGETVAEPDLKVPHPRLCERVFALRPLLDVAPDARDPRTALAYASLAEASASIRRLDPG